MLAEHVSMAQGAWDVQKPNKKNGCWFSAVQLLNCCAIDVQDKMKGAYRVHPFLVHVCIQACMHGVHMVHTPG